MKTKITERSNVSNNFTIELVSTLFAISQITGKLAAKMTSLEEQEKEGRGVVTICDIPNLAKELDECGNILIAISKNLVKLQSLQNPKKNS